MREPKFNSAFAPMMYAFWKKREQEGYNNKNQIYYLEEFDRLIMQGYVRGNENRQASDTDKAASVS